MAGYLREMSRASAEARAEGDVKMRMQQEFEFPDESVWLQRHYAESRTMR